VIRIAVNPANPAHYFGSCGVFELAQRLWPGALGCFGDGHFLVTEGDLAALVEQVAGASIEVLEPANETSSALRITGPFDLRLDWWKVERGLKTWAGRMSVDRIAKGLQRDLKAALDRGFFDDGHVVTGVDGKKVEPYYFDARRGATALPLDLGFSSDELGVETVAYCATEFFTLIGLQRFRPLQKKPRLYCYRVWARPLPVTLAALAASTVIPDHGPVLQFESAFRTDQRKHKAFTSAVPVIGDGHD
jgi:CRISPR-associated protein Csb3